MEWKSEWLMMSGESTEPMEEVSLIGLGESEMGFCHDSAPNDRVPHYPAPHDSVPA